MSRVTVDNIAVGESCTITSPNSTISSLATATAAVDATNVRQEGIDLRNLMVPGSSFLEFEQFPSGSLGASPIGTANITNTNWAQCPVFAGQTPVIIINPANAAFFVVRFSVLMMVHGSPPHSSSTASALREKIGWVALGMSRSGRSYQVVDETVRSWQVANIPGTTADSNDNDIRQSVHIVYVEQIDVKDRNTTFKFTPMVKMTPTTAVDHEFKLFDPVLSASVYRRA